MLGDKVAADAAIGPWTQVSRLGNPLFNEVIVPMSKKDLWNTLPPTEDKRFAGSSSSRSWRRCCRCSTRVSSPTWTR